MNKAEKIAADLEKEIERDAARAARDALMEQETAERISSVLKQRDDLLHAMYDAWKMSDDRAAKAILAGVLAHAEYPPYLAHEAD